MPLGIVSDTEFDKELDNEVLVPVDNSVSDESITIPIAKIINPTPLGRPEGKKDTPDCVRKVIAEEALNGASGKELAELFNVGPQVPSVYKSGALSQATYNEKQPSLNSHVTKIKHKLVNKAANRMKTALNALTEEKIAECDGKEIAGIAKDMSAIIKNLTPESDDESDKGVQFVFFAPQMRKESEYDVIDVSTS